nr:hypothetical protein [Desulfofustis glycolicus]
MVRYSHQFEDLFLLPDFSIGDQQDTLEDGRAGQIDRSLQRIVHFSAAQVRLKIAEAASDLGDGVFAGRLLVIEITAAGAAEDDDIEKILR